jgi:hypothetical protein
MKNYLPTYSGKIIICPFAIHLLSLLNLHTYLPTYLPTYLVITARLPVLWMEFAQVQVILPPEVSGQEFWWEAGLGNLKFVIGQKIGGTMDSTHGAFKQTNGLWLCPTCEGFHLDLQNGHVDFAE